MQYNKENIKGGNTNNSNDDQKTQMLQQLFTDFSQKIVDILEGEENEVEEDKNNEEEKMEEEVEKINNSKSKINNQGIIKKQKAK